jgi:hypothetical protein
MNRDTELAIAAQIRSSLETVEAVLIHNSTADVTEPCLVQVTVTVERSAYVPDKTVVRLSLSSTVKHSTVEA